MKNLTFNGQQVDVILNTLNRCNEGHGTTMLYRNATTSYAVKGTDRLDCIDSLNRCYPETLNDFRPSIEYFTTI